MREIHAARATRQAEFCEFPGFLALALPMLMIWLNLNHNRNRVGRPVRPKAQGCALEGTVDHGTHWEQRDPTMKTPQILLRPVLPMALLALQALSASAVLFTNDTLIRFDNTNFDGQEIIVTNSTLTVDGPHTFAALHLLSGGVLTHSFAPNGLLENRLHISGEQVTLNAPNPPSLGQTNVLTDTVVVTDTSGSIAYARGTDYDLLTLGDGRTLIGRVDGTSIPQDATVSVSYDYLGLPVASGLNLAVNNNVEIEIGGAIKADGRGYGPSLGPGAGASSSTSSPYYFVAGSGGACAGFGGSSSLHAPGGSAYAATTSPNDKGSGGGGGSGPGGAGGGLVRLSMGGLLRVDGQISANGANGTSSHSGGGAGGGIYLSAQTFSGTGSISASGGAGEPPDGGGRGGGPIAIFYNANQFTGSISAHGGTGATFGGAGTIYTKAASNTVGQILADNGGWRGTNTLLSVAGPFFDLTIGGGAVVYPSLNAAAFHNLLIQSNGWLTYPASKTSLALTVTGDATVQRGGGIIADALGYPGRQGPGAGGYFIVQSTTIGGGGGYGGYGGAGSTNAPGGLGYGSVTDRKSKRLNSSPVALSPMPPPSS